MSDIENRWDVVYPIQRRRAFVLETARVRVRVGFRRRFDPVIGAVEQGGTQSTFPVVDLQVSIDRVSGRHSSLTEGTREPGCGVISITARRTVR